VTGNLHLQAITAGGHHTCGLADAGLVWCWGQNDFGQLGDGGTAEQLSPVSVLAGLNFTELSAGGKHSCGRLATGELYCWGSNEDGQLGDGTTIDRFQPSRVFFRLCCQAGIESSEGLANSLCTCRVAATK
jgi:alpha-tubulin suppressor-like RCC1 family protein